MSREQQLKVRKQLESKLEDIGTASADRSGLIAERATDEIDRGPQELAVDFTVHAINLDWAKGRSIRAALARVDSGKYGICEACGGSIAPMRLVAIPWADLCAPCQAASEVAEDAYRVFEKVA